MPYTVSITRDEAELLQAAEIDGVEGNIFTFSPADTMVILSKVADATEADALGRSRLTDRLATLYGRHLAHVRNRETAQAPTPEPVFADVPEVITLEVKPDDVVEPIEHVTLEKRPRRR